jgi:hypothetical protein
MIKSARLKYRSSSFHTIAASWYNEPTHKKRAALVGAAGGDRNNCVKGSRKV